MRWNLEFELFISELYFKIFNFRKLKNELNRKEMWFYNVFIVWKFEIRFWIDRIFIVCSE